DPHGHAGGIVPRAADVGAGKGVVDQQLASQPVDQLHPPAPLRGGKPRIGDIAGGIETAELGGDPLTAPPIIPQHAAVLALFHETSFFLVWATGSSPLTAGRASPSPPGPRQRPRRRRADPCIPAG